MNPLEPLSDTQTQRLTAGFAALAICIHLFESSLPSILGIKPGLANIITLIVLLRYGLRMAINVQLLRVFIASLLNGSIFTPTFFLSLSGSLAALLGLALVHFFMTTVRQTNPITPLMPFWPEIRVSLPTVWWRPWPICSDNSYSPMYG